MELVVDLTAVTVVLADAEDLHRLAVRVREPRTASPDVIEDVHRLTDVLVAAHAGRAGPDGDVLVDPAALRFHAAGQVGEGWDERFAAMLDFAATRGWLDDEGFLHAHVVWPDATGPT